MQLGSHSLQTQQTKSLASHRLVRAFGKIEKMECLGKTLGTIEVVQQLVAFKCQDSTANLFRSKSSKISARISYRKNDMICLREKNLRKTGCLIAVWIIK